MILTESHSLSIDKDRYIETDKAYGLFVKRSDGVVLPNPEYFPKSVINPKVEFGKLKCTIPDWLWDKKVGSNYTIVEN